MGRLERPPLIPPLTPLGRAAQPPPQQPDEAHQVARKRLVIRAHERRQTHCERSPCSADQLEGLCDVFSDCVCEKGDRREIEGSSGGGGSVGGTRAIGGG